MIDTFPMVPLAKNQALCVGVFSYDGQVNFGLIGDYDSLSDLDDVASDLAASLSELLEAAGGKPGFLRRFVPGTSRQPAAARGNGTHGEAQSTR